jgi:hypothetical protein
MFYFGGKKGFFLSILKRINLDLRNLCCFEKGVRVEIPRC